jgi:DNA polymerase III alpha subunit
MFKTGPEYVKAAPMDRMTMLAGEREATGLFLSGHPLDDTFRPEDAIPLSSLCECEDGSEAKTRVLCTNYEERQTRNGQIMATVFFEDETGEQEAVCFPRDWAKIATEVQNAFRKDLPLLVYLGIQVEVTDGDEGETKAVKAILRKVTPMEDAPSAPTVGYGVSVTIPARLATDEGMALLLDRLSACPGTLPVTVILDGERTTLDGITVGERVFTILPALGYTVEKGA